MGSRNLRDERRRPVNPGSEDSDEDDDEIPTVAVTTVDVLVPS